MDMTNEFSQCLHIGNLEFRGRPTPMTMSTCSNIHSRLLCHMSITIHGHSFIQLSPDQCSISSLEDLLIDLNPTVIR